MPLESGPSRTAFEHNLKTELAAGKAEPQALAIAYAKARGDSARADYVGKLDATLAACDRLTERMDGLERKADSLRG